MKRELGLLLLLIVTSGLRSLAGVEVQRLPAGAMQPLAVTEDTGTVHLVWNGSSKAEPKPAEGSPLLYSRSDDPGQSFEPQRNFMGKTALLNGGASVAADRTGNVDVVWHAAPAADPTDETARRVFLARSSDDGGTFQAEKSISLTNGVCGCCALRAFVDRAGSLSVLYRAAITRTDRHITLLSSSDHGATFRQVLTDPWPTGSCPMSSASLVDSSQGVFAARETKGRIQAAIVPPKADELFAVTSASAGERDKHPALAVNARGEVLCAWSEGTGWQKGGSVSWRTLDAKGRPTGEQATRAGLPVWSFPAVFARDDGQFVIAFWPREGVRRCPRGFAGCGVGMDEGRRRDRRTKETKRLHTYES